MTFSTSLARATARVFLAAGLVLGLSAPNALAQEAPAAASAVAMSTLDVCATGTGQWRYSGVVAVLDAQGGSLATDSRVQNQTSRAGFRDAAGGASAPAASSVRAGDTVVLPYVFEGAPLTLGEVRSQS